MKIYFFDTETTGNTPDSHLCQLAVKEMGVDEPVLNNLYKPPVPIPIECTMVHGITNKAVADKPAFPQSPEYGFIKSLFEDPDTILAAHNCAFDEQILHNDGIYPTNMICTFKVIRNLDDENKFAMHKLQYLRYALDMELDAPAHDAWGDVVVLEKLFDYELVTAMTKWNMDQDRVLEEMMRITTEPITFRHFSFGKYKGKTIEEVAATDPGYLRWLLDQKKQSEQDETDWIHTLQKYVK